MHAYRVMPILFACRLGYVVIVQLYMCAKFIHGDWSLLGRTVKIVRRSKSSIDNYWAVSIYINSVNLCLSVCLSVILSVCQSVCNSVCLYLAHLANLSHDRLRARPVYCTGPDNVLCQVLVVSASYTFY